ncbi:F-box-like domain-containing protein [Legionella micdadei]|uniref:F-box domain-containing protein n=1 Tax=Legionella micdadei TaxID=451 RepID=A0A098GHG2_LEGMI|nr:F-box-like domain-containing protein [Legionella micdadei]ARG97126.1 hypothetical protein B6N58_05310 [Legionella micdadei]KTD29279.1 Ankyrin repeats (3 copies) [Legionella micdadei]NSL17348.1 F-box protein [Legionella micdadei]CEG61435.1 conserved protein of unknown function (ankyrin domain)[F-box][Coiled-coil] [Legionella micdadei]SCY40951.1 hypothetical protein SAMN02982997_01643 [Legionella micdadei]
MREKDVTFIGEQKQISELPDEVWLTILSFLDPQSLIKAQIIDHRFSQLANDNYPWKVLFRTYFPEEMPYPVPVGFNWKEAFIAHYLEQYGAYPPETKRRIFFIATGNINKLQECNITHNDLKENEFILVKTAARLGRQDILDYFYQLPETVWNVGTKEEEESLESVGQRLSSPINPRNQEVSFLMNPFYWAIRCNQKNKINQELPGLLNEPEMGTGKTATMLAAEFGHLDLLIKLLNHPENKAISEGYRDLSVSLVKSGQMRMLIGFDDFIAGHREKVNHVQGLEREHSAKIVNGAKNLPCRTRLAARHGAIAIFKVHINRLYQSLLKAEQALAAVKENRVSRNADEALKEETAAVEAYEMIKKQFSSTINAALYVAATYGQISIIAYALERRFIGINEILQDDGSTLLSRAAQSYHPKLVRFLLNQQGDPQQALAALSDSLWVSPQDQLVRNRMSASILYQIEEMLVRAIEERNEPIRHSLLRSVILAKQPNLLERLLVLDIGDINKPNSSGTTLLEEAVKEAPDFMRDKCLDLLLSKGAVINARVFKAAVMHGDTMFVYHMSIRSKDNMRDLVNKCFVYGLPILCGLSKDSIMHELLLPFVDFQESISVMIKEGYSLNSIRDVLFHHDSILNRPPFDTEEILAFAKTFKNRKRITRELEIEVELEKKLRTKHSLYKVSAFEKLKIQIQAAGLAKGLHFSSNHTSLPKKINFPSELSRLTAFTLLVDNSQVRTNLLKELYVEAYKEGFAKGRSKVSEKGLEQESNNSPNEEEKQSHKRKRGKRTARKEKAKKRKSTASTEQQGLQSAAPFPEAFVTTTTVQTNPDDSEAGKNSQEVAEIQADQYETGSLFFPTSIGYSIRFFSFPEPTPQSAANPKAIEDIDEQEEVKFDTNQSLN